MGEADPNSRSLGVANPLDVGLLCEVSIPPSRLGDQAFMRKQAQQASGLPADQFGSFRIVRRSVDSRKRPVYRLRLEVFSQGEKISEAPSFSSRFLDVEAAPPVHIIGAGPAGYFAAIECLMQGRKPIVLERGKDVRLRRRDLRAVQQEGVVDPHSNYCFGEGGAGTYSDGKLYTRSKKRGDVEAVLQILVEHGANPEILIDAHPHIGSNKLPGIISNLRTSIQNHGGEVHFDTWITDFEIEGTDLKALTTATGQRIATEQVILATGHSARDIYQLLLEREIAIEVKNFAVGVRVEHPQALIDQIQYRQRPREEGLPAASYRLSTQVGDLGVFSFCMCPGGLIVPAATAHGEMVTNGMSLSRRDSPYANAGVVVSISETMLARLGLEGPLAGIEFQRQLEQSMFQANQQKLKAPAQRLVDFLNGQPSSNLPDCSYIPGLIETRLDQLLPEFLAGPLRAGLTKFGQMMHGFVTNDAVVVGIESRTSSPVRIPRATQTLQHPQIKGLFPCGEGAGFAGGIVSAAIDGRRVAAAVCKHT